MAGPGGTDRSVNVTDGKLAGPLVVLSAPIVASQLLNVAYNLADTYWVGRLGEDAVAALSYSWAIVFLMVSVGGGLTVAGTVLVSQNKGAGDFRQSHHIAGQTLSFVTLIAAGFGIVGYVATPFLLSLIGAVPGSAPHTLATQYTRVIFVGVLFMFWFFIFDALSRGWGDTRTPLYLMAVSAAVNVVIDPFLILGFVNNPVFAWIGMEAVGDSLYAATGFEGYGVAGAAVATVIARGLAAVAGLYLLFSGRVGLQPQLEDLWLKRKTVRKIFDIGAPIATEQGFRSLGIALLTAIIAIAGDQAVAAYGIVNRLSSLMFLPALGLARGTETVVGQNIGAAQFDRAKRAVYISSGLVIGVFTVVLAIAIPYAEPIVAFFLETTGEQSAVIEIGAAYIVIAGPAYVFLGVFQVMLGGFRGAGSTRLAMIFSLQELWLFRLPIAYAALTWFALGITGVWYAVAISFVASAITTAIWFFRGTWMNRVVDGAETTESDENRGSGESAPSTDTTGGS